MSEAETQQEQGQKKPFWEDFMHYLQKDLFAETFETLYNKGFSAYKRKDYTKAIEFYEKAYDKKSKDFNCLYNLALSHQRKEDYKNAIKFYNLALDVNQKDYDAIYNIGLCHLASKNAALAIDFLKQATVLNDRDYDAAMSYILALVEDKQIDEAIKLTVELVKYNRNLLDFVLSAAKAIEKKSSISENDENLNKAIKLINSYLEQNDKNSTAYLQLSTCYSKKGQWKDALKYSLDAFELSPRSYEVNLNTGFVLYCNQSYERALTFYKTALSLNKNAPSQLHINIAHAYEKMGLIDDAVKKIEYVLEHFKEQKNKDALEKYLNVLKHPETKGEEEFELKEEIVSDEPDEEIEETEPKEEAVQEYEDPYQELADET